MTAFIASAPGKVFLSGEYAVLDGAPAVLAAVDRRATARFKRSPSLPSPVVAAVMAEIAIRFPGSCAGGEARISVRTPGFALGRAKIGLGSSAAVAAATAGLLIATARDRADIPSDEILEVALAAHKRAQGGRGSGADVAAATYGGALAYRIAEAPVRLGDLPVATVFAWTGRSASTTELISRIQEFARRNPGDHAVLQAELGGLAEALARVYAGGDGPEVLRLTAAYGAAMDRLGRAAGAPIVTEAHARIAGLAETCGGAGKPSGAGGGDLALAVFADREGARRFAGLLDDEKLVRVDLRCGAEGVCVAAR